MTTIDKALSRSTFFSRFKRAEPSDELQGLADGFFEQERINQQAALRCFVGNLTYWLALPEHEKLPEGQMINMTRDSYCLPNSATKNRYIGHSAMYAMKGFFEQEGLITVIKGFKDTHATIIKPTEKFMKIQFNDEQFPHPLDEEAAQNEIHHITASPKSPTKVFYDKVEGDIWVREPKKSKGQTGIRPKVKAENVESAKQSLDIINANIVSHRWSFRPENEAVEKAVPIILIDKKIGDELIINNNCLYLDRVYNNNEMTWGGRFYCALSNAPRGIRPSLFVNGERVAEADFKSMHILLAMAELGLQPTKPDLYSLSTLTSQQNTEWRSLIKSSFLALINLPDWRGWKGACYNAYHAQVEKSKRECKLSGEVAPEAMSEEEVEKLLPTILAAIKHDFPMLEPYLASNAGVRLMNTDARIMEMILLAAAEEGVPCFGLHDAAFVPEKELDWMVEIMSWAFQCVTNVELKASSIKTVIFSKPSGEAPAAASKPALKGGYIPKKYLFRPSQPHLLVEAE